MEKGDIVDVHEEHRGGGGRQKVAVVKDSKERDENQLAMAAKDNHGKEIVDLTEDKHLHVTVKRPDVHEKVTYKVNQATRMGRLMGKLAFTHYENKDKN